ncbi:hypothetical protein AVEN_157357-1 [Araneus ventricosus]|uniref:Uncharacterized protein n=1 Tax=Araneus ventricosus TaxID=182803 RepID=A0A4Y2GW02_ARAVE|nr:hypothetical protein AVEN_157357-1 [Araneus ventricosus]
MGRQCLLHNHLVPQPNSCCNGSRHRDMGRRSLHPQPAVPSTIYSCCNGRHRDMGRRSVYYIPCLCPLQPVVAVMAGKRRDRAAFSLLHLCCSPQAVQLLCGNEHRGLVGGVLPTTHLQSFFKARDKFQ